MSSVRRSRPPPRTRRQLRRRSPSRALVSSACSPPSRRSSRHKAPQAHIPRHRMPPPHHPHHHRLGRCRTARRRSRATAQRRVRHAAARAANAACDELRTRRDMPVHRRRGPHASRVRMLCACVHDQSHTPPQCAGEFFLRAARSAAGAQGGELSFSLSAYPALGPGPHIYMAQPKRRLKRRRAVTVARRSEANARRERGAEGTGARRRTPKGAGGLGDSERTDRAVRRWP